MKPFIIGLVVLILVCPVFAAEDIAEYDDVAIDVIIDGKFDIQKQAEDGIIRDLEANLLFFPITTENQQIAVLENLISGDGKVTENSTMVKYFWKEPSETVSFQRLASVNSFSKIVEVKQKVAFPLSPYDLPPEIRPYLLPSPKIDINKEIKDKANSLAAGETDLYVVAHTIAAWVHDYVNYTLNNETESNVLSASWVFENGIGVCDEIANLFVSMMRAIGVPARFVSGIVYSNTDIGFGNHGWAEVYFPGYGWVPFDPTFGQYGYVDPGHIKFQDSTDSGVSALEYRWKSRDATVISQYLNVSAVLKEKKSVVNKLVNISVIPYEREINFGSYLPIRVTLKNVVDYYVPAQVYIAKSPKIVGSVVKYVLLKPSEEKDIYFIANIESDLDKNYLYKSSVEVKTNWLTAADAGLEYHRKAPSISEIEAEQIVKTDEERDQKEFFSNIEVYCDTDQESYYPGEKVNLSCMVSNAGNTQLDIVKVCLDNAVCDDISLGISDYHEFSYQQWPKKEYILSVETPNKFKEEKINPRIINVPIVSIVNVSALSLSYKETKLFSLNLAHQDAEDIEVSVNGKRVALTNETILFSLSGKDASTGILVEVNYKDAAEKEYSLKNRLSVDVKDLPLYLKLKRFILGLFYTNI